MDVDPLEWLYNVATFCGQHAETMNGTWDQITKVLAILGPFLAAGIAYAAYTVANRQREIAQAKLKLDLFDRRAKVYDATVRFLSCCRDYAPEKNVTIVPSEEQDAVKKRVRQKEESVKEFLEIKVAARFILGAELADHLDELERQYEKLQLARRNRAFAERRKKSDEMTKAMQQDLEISEWLGEQSKTITDKFAPFMDLARWQ